MATETQNTEHAGIIVKPRDGDHGQKWGTGQIVTIFLKAGPLNDSFKKW